MVFEKQVREMEQKRLRQRITSFREAVARLEQACRQEDNEFIRDSVIQRFEFCYELAWKMLKLALAEEGLEATTPKQVIREATTAQWITDGNLWTEMQRMRNETSHTYDQALARKVYRFVCDQGLALFLDLKETSDQWLN